MDFSVACSSPSFFPYVSGGKWLPECYQKGRQSSGAQGRPNSCRRYGYQCGYQRRFFRADLKEISPFAAFFEPFGSCKGRYTLLDTLETVSPAGISLPSSKF